MCMKASVVDRPVDSSYDADEQPSLTYPQPDGPASDWPPVPNQPGKSLTMSNNMIGMTAAALHNLRDMKAEQGDFITSAVADLLGVAILQAKSVVITSS